MSDWFDNLEGLYQELWDTLIQGVVNPNHSARNATFATVSPNNWPEARTVIMRAADTEASTIEIYTDVYSDKIRSLEATPRAAILVWDAEKSLQVRLTVEVGLDFGPAVRRIYDNLREESKTNYGITPAPGRPIKNGLDYKKVADPESFAILHCSILTIDALHLGEKHRRAIYSNSDGWAGQWLAP